MRHFILVGVLSFGTVAPAVAHLDGDLNQKSVSVDVFGHLAEREVDPTREALNKLSESASELVATVGEDATLIVTNMWDMVNPCSEVVRANVIAAFVAARSYASILANFALEYLPKLGAPILKYWPKVRAPIKDLVSVMVVVVGKLVAETYDATVGPTLGPKVDELKLRLQVELQLIKDSLGATVEEANKQLPEARETKLVQRLTAFANSVAELTGLLSSGGKALYGSDPVQSRLNTLQVKTGELLAQASTALSVRVTSLTEAALDKVNGYARAAVAAVNLCDPSARDRAMQATIYVTDKYVEIVRVLMAVIDIEGKAAALKEQWQSDKYTQIRNNLKKSIMDVTQNIVGQLSRLSRRHSAWDTVMDDEVAFAAITAALP